MSPQVSARAVTVVADIARLWGEDLGDGVVRIRRTQAAMAADLGCSAGTLAWYLRSAGTSVRRDNGEILIDRSTIHHNAPTTPSGRSRDLSGPLIEHFGVRGANGVVELLDGNGRPPTTRAMADVAGCHHSTIEDHLSRMEAAGTLERLGRRLLLRHSAAPGNHPGTTATGDGGGTGEENSGTTTATATAANVSGTDLISQLSHALALLAEAANTLAGLATQFHPDPRVGRHVADPRDMAADIAHPVRSDNQPVVVLDSVTKNSRKPTTTSPYTPENPAATIRQRAAAGTARSRPETSDHPACCMTGEELDSILEPLITDCRRYAMPTIVDKKGRLALRRQDPAAVRAAVVEVRRLARVGELKTPLGFLVSRALKDPSYFDSALSDQRQPVRLPERSAAEPGAAEDNPAALGESRWLAQVLNTEALSQMIADYRRQNPWRGDRTAGAMARMITRAARDAAAVHRDLDPAIAVSRHTQAHLDALLEEPGTPVQDTVLPQVPHGLLLRVCLRDLEADQLGAIAASVAP